MIHILAKVTQFFSKEKIQMADTILDKSTPNYLHITKVINLMSKKS